MYTHLLSVRTILKSVYFILVPGEGILERAVSECSNGAEALLLRSFVSEYNCMFIFELPAE